MTAHEQIQQMLASQHGECAPLDQVLITERLQERSARPPDYRAENLGLTALAQELATNSENVLQRLCEVALELCQASSAGVSIEEEVDGTRIFRWRALAGEMASYLHSVTPYSFAPCGIVVQKDAPQLFSHPVRHYPYVKAIEPYIYEVLLIPFRMAGKPVGTVWVVSSKETRQFDLEDERLLTNLSQFAAAALQALESQKAVQDTNTQLAAEIEQHQHTLASVRKSEAHLRSILESSADCIKILDTEGGLLTMNLPGMCLMEIDDFTAVRGRKWPSFWHGDDQAKAEQALEQALKEGSAHFQGYCATAKGTLKWWDVVLTVIPGTAGEPVSLLGVSRDLTELRESARRLEEKSEEIETLNLRLRQSMTETHHRVKNNLQLISALIDIQQSAGADMVPMSELVRLGSSVRALGVIHDVLTQDSKLDSQETDLSVKTVLEKLLTTLQQTLGRGYQLTYAIDEIRLPGRKVTSLALVTNELFSNALKHGNGSVTVVFRVEPDAAWLEVSDNGPGFPTGFVASTWANTGLSLVETVGCHDLGGAVFYENQPAGGAHIRLRVPLDSKS